MGADLDLVDYYGYSPLRSALVAKKLKIAKFLINKGALFNFKTFLNKNEVFNQRAFLICKNYVNEYEKLTFLKVYIEL